MSVPAVTPCPPVDVRRPGLEEAAARNIRVCLSVRSGWSRHIGESRGDRRHLRPGKSLLGSHTLSKVSGRRARVLPVRRTSTISQELGTDALADRAGQPLSTSGVLACPQGGRSGRVQRSRSLRATVSLSRGDKRRSRCPLHEAGWEVIPGYGRTLWGLDGSRTRRPATRAARIRLRSSIRCRLHHRSALPPRRTGGCHGPHTVPQ